MTIPTLWGLHSLEQWLWVLGWCAVVQGLAWAVFQSWPAVALQEKLRLLNAAEAHRIRTLSQEIAQGRQALVGQQTPLRKGVMLDHAQVQARADELQKLLKVSRGRRTFQELFACTLCQRFWVAFCLTLLDAGFLESLCNAAGFSVLAGALFLFLEKKGGGCGGR